LSYTFAMAEPTDPLPPGATAALGLAERLGAAIMDGLAIGTQLPTEADLAAAHGVSRVTVREALKILSGRGLVSLSRGRRAMVSQPDGAMFGAFLRSIIRSDPRALFDLLQVRRTLELQSATAACRTHSRAGLTAIEAALALMQAALDRMPAEGVDPVTDLAFVQADVKFHQAIALAGGNRVLIYLFEAMETSLVEAFQASQRGIRNTRTVLAESYQTHRAIFDLIAARDERGAAEAMMAHLARAESNLRLSLKGASLSPGPGEAAVERGR
jgi:DNA-binding FadR family transcriptional regulator